MLRWIPLFALAAALPAQVDLLHISDTHVAQLDGAHPDLARARAIHRDSLGKLDRFVTAANAAPPATVIITGDIVDSVCLDGAAGQPVYGQIDAVAGALARLQRPYHLVLGNHDVECYRRNPQQPDRPIGDQSVAANTRQRWHQAFRPLKKAYYSRPLPAPGYRLIAIDNGQALDSAGGRAYLEKQLKWLRKELNRRKRENVILAMHIPLAADERSLMVKQALDQAPQVKLILCGHRHSDGLEWLTFASHRLLQVRTAALFLDPANARRIRLTNHAIEISETKEPARVSETSGPGPDQSLSHSPSRARHHHRYLPNKAPEHATAIGISQTK